MFIDYQSAFPDLRFVISGKAYHIPKESYVMV